MACDANELAEPSPSEISPVHREETPHIHLFNNMSEVAVRGTSDSDGEIAVRTGEREIYRSASIPLGIHESRVHGFAIVDQPPTYSVDLKVSRAGHLTMATNTGIQLSFQNSLLIVCSSIQKRKRSREMCNACMVVMNKS